MSLTTTHLVGFGARRSAAPSGHRYWKLNFTAANSGSYMEVQELELKSGGTDQIPLMTSYTTSGVTISASSENASTPVWTVGDNNTASSSNAWTSSSTVPQWIKVDFGSAVAIDAYSITSRAGGSTYRPADWTLAYSDDDSSYTTVDTRTGETFSGAAVTNTYTIP